VVNEVPAEPRGLGGWLILLGLSLAAAVVGMGLYLWFEWFESFQLIANDTVRDLIRSGDPWRSRLGYLILAETAANTGLFVFALHCLELFFRRSRSFPRHAKFLFGASAVVMLADLLTARSLGLPVDARTTTETARAFVWAVTWTAYLNRSRRVANTFVR